MPTARSFPNISGHFLAITKPLCNSTQNKQIKKKQPANPNSSPIIAKIKSVIWITMILSLSFIIKDKTICNLCIFGVLFQTLTIMKLSYKIFNVKLGYLEYEKSL